MGATTKRYRVTAGVTISVSTVVEASSKKAAIAAALKQPMMSLCHQCATGEDTQEWVTHGEIDGEPTELCAELEPDDDGGT